MIWPLGSVECGLPFFYNIYTTLSSRFREARTSTSGVIGENFLRKRGKRNESRLYHHLWNAKIIISIAMTYWTVVSDSLGMIRELLCLTILI